MRNSTERTVTVEEVDALLLENNQLREALQRRRAVVLGRLRHLATLRVALVPERIKSQRKLVPASQSHCKPTTLRYLEDCTVGPTSPSPFCDVGIHSVRNNVCYGKLPLSKDEVRWNELLSVFPQPSYLHSSAMVLDSGGTRAKTEQFTRDEDRDLRDRVLAYHGPRCGPSFWASLRGTTVSRFDIASRYVKLQQHRTIPCRKTSGALLWDAEKERLKALEEAVSLHLDDKGKIFAAYVEIVSEAARRHMYLSEVSGGERLVFPPYVWVKRSAFNRLVDSVVRRFQAPAVRLEGNSTDDMPLAKCYKVYLSSKPSESDLMACLLAFKGKILGKGCSLRTVERVFRPTNRTWSLRPSDFTAVQGCRKRSPETDLPEDETTQKCCNDTPMITHH
uniref:Uncharacterized protein n=1 Tax=Trypanosoma congolense (strain IL3000) TaxID=1068625 RepID=G0UM33_TRYCI|nr:conserved hypothetical protein [Trypanosoma congolense IL3000]